MHSMVIAVSATVSVSESEVLLMIGRKKLAQSHLNRYKGRVTNKLRLKLCQAQVEVELC